MGTGVNYTYQWLRDGLPIVGATARTYSIDQSDLGSKITFRVCGSKELHQTACLVSETSNIIALGQFVKSPAIRISLKSYKLGSVIQGLPGVWDSGVTLTYSWLRDGIPIFGETAATYAINQADQGHEITFRVIAQKPGYQDAIKESAARKIS
jgi:hypothetical protein